MLTIKELNKILNGNGGAIIDNIPIRHIESFDYVRTHLQQTNVNESEELKEKLADLHQFDRLRVKPVIRKKFYELLENRKNDSNLDPIELSRELYGVRPKNYRSKDFSLVTRLMHSVHENYPIYDSNIEEMFEYELPLKAKAPAFKKLHGYMGFYKDLIDTYKEMILDEKAYDLLRVVKIKFSAHKNSLTTSKCMDLVVRSAGELKRKGQLFVLAKP